MERDTEEEREKGKLRWIKQQGGREKNQSRRKAGGQEEKAKGRGRKGVEDV